MAQKMIDQKLEKTSAKPAGPKKSPNSTGSSTTSSPRGRPAKRKSVGPLSPQMNQKHRQCEKAGCPTKIPICFARVTERCAGSGWTSRWYHLSPAEHFCNECFEYFYRKEGYDAYALWKQNWGGKATVEVNVRTYMADQYLPHWLQCSLTGCHKWRQLTKDAHMTPEFITRFTCGMNALGVKKDNQTQCCAVPEDERVSYTKTVPWLQQLIMVPKLRDSPTVPYVSTYFSEDVGLRPSKETYSNGTEDVKFDGYVQPFHDVDTAIHANMFQPASLTPDEELEFSCYAKNPALSMYIGARNLVMTLWAQNCRNRLTYIDCMKHLVCRGICRIHYVELIKYIIASFTQQGIINYGFLPNSPPIEPLSDKTTSVTVIGAGAAGLSAAYQLSQCGLKVIVLEARQRIGGRIHDDHTMGVCVGTGAQCLSGEVNNPVSVMAHQIGGRLKHAGDGCCVMNYRGEFVSSSVDRRVEFHFNALLDIVAEWRKKKSASCDRSLYDKIIEMHQQFIEQTQLKFSEEELQAFNFQLANLELVCGAPLSQVSSIFWDQNEDSPQFAGSQMLLVDGYAKILADLAEKLDIRYDWQVCHIDYSGNTATVHSASGQSVTSDKVIVTVPVSILRTSAILFSPPLPEKKVKAFNKIGIGMVEKVVLKFSRNFWSLKVKNAPCFGRTTRSPQQRGLFPIFYDLSSSKLKSYVLVSHICGEALDLIRQQTDEEVMTSCLNVLRALFPVEDIGPPLQYFVTHWRDDPFARMAYSYLPVGVNGTVYDTIADTVDDMIYFAGEATSSDYPQSVTGAYLSGVREANKILAAIYDADDT